MCRVSLTVVVLLLVLAAPASAAPPVCEAGPFLYDLPAGLTHLHPRAPCTDADGDAITVEVRTPPHLGTLTPAGTVPISEVRFYTAGAAAAGMAAPRDTMTFVAHAGGEESSPVTVDVKILPPDHAPVCDDLSVTVKSGRSVRIPAPHCVDADNDKPQVIFDKPAHGSYDPKTGRYRPDSGFTGKDTMRFAAVDYWNVSSKTGKVTIRVTKGTGPGGSGPGSRDRRAPRLKIAAPSSLELGRALRGIPFTAKTDEGGRLTVKLYVSLRSARRYDIGRRVGRTVRHVVAGRSVLKARFSRAARAGLKDAGTVRLKLVARLADAAGNTRTRRVRITLSPG
jgi:hypothetical protein